VHPPEEQRPGAVIPNRNIPTFGQEPIIAGLKHTVPRTLRI
jgi:hypothetical protein